MLVRRLLENILEVVCALDDIDLDEVGRDLEEAVVHLVGCLVGQRMSGHLR